MSVLILIIAIYVLSYVLIRWKNTGYREVDGCPSEGCETVYLQQGTFYLFYKPLIHVDMRLTHADFTFTN